MSDVGEQAPRRAQQQHEPAAHRGPEQDRQVAAARVEADRARQCSAPTMSWMISCVAGAPITPAAPWTSRITTACQICSVSGEEEHAPRDRRHHEERLRDLDQLAAVVAVGQRARVDREEQERHPVADDGEAAERRRVERLEDDPVADDVLDVVGRHRHQAEREVAPVVAGVQRREARAATVAGPGRASGHRRDRTTTSPGGLLRATTTFA